MNKYVLFLLVLLQSFMDLQAQILNDSSIGANNAVGITTTTLRYEQRQGLADSIAKWKSHKQFQYIGKLDSLLKQKQQNELDSYNDSLREKPESVLDKFFASGLPQGIFGIVVFLFILILLYRILVSNGIFKKQATRMPAMDNEETAAASSALNYDVLIKHAQENGDYRLAIRYHFLKTLRILSNKEYIVFASGKTNYDYVQEMDTPFKDAFASLVLVYEYTWYAQHDVHVDEYAVMEKKFSMFLKMYL